MRQLGMFSLRYLHTSGVAPGQLVSSSSSKPLSCISPVNPPGVSKLHPESTQKIEIKDDVCT